MNTIRFKRNADTPARAAERRLVPLLHGAAWFAGIALLTAFTGIAELCGVLLAVALLLALFGLFQRLFRVVQMRVLELAWLVAAFGTVAGLCAQVVRDGAAGRSGIEPFFVVLLGGCGLAWILGGLTSGLYVAQRLKTEDTWERLGFVALYTLQPVAILGLLFTAVFLLFGLPYHPRTPPLWLSLSLLASPVIGFNCIGSAWYWKQEARRAERT